MEIAQRIASSARPVDHASFNGLLWDT
jgi:hypothetical protein